MPTTQLSVYFFLQVAIVIAICQLVGRLARWIGQPQVVGEMIAVVMLGP
jgi:Kef-type K+ transport system membrane component KefB